MGRLTLKCPPQEVSCPSATSYPNPSLRLIQRILSGANPWLPFFYLFFASKQSRNYALPQHQLRLALWTLNSTFLQKDPPRASPDFLLDRFQ
jgi:hypothetical protein